MSAPHRSSGPFWYCHPALRPLPLPPHSRNDLQLAWARKEKLGLKKEPRSIITLLPLKLPSSQPGDVQPYLEERSERVESGSRGWRSLEKIFWLREENIYS